MVRRKRKSTTKRVSYKPDIFRSSKKRKVGAHGRHLKQASMITLAASVVVCLAAAAGMGFVSLEKYVEQIAPLPKLGSIELVGLPAWVNDQLKAKVCAAIAAGGKSLEPDKYLARAVQNDLVRQVAWLGEVRVRTTAESIRVEAVWRKPLALVNRGARKFFVDAGLVVLDYVPVPDLPVVEVRGLSKASRLPQAGEVWRQDDLAAAVSILARLDRMDKLVTPDKPLLGEIESIDVGNFGGRETRRGPHIVLYAKDNTQIIWGAEIGAWQHHLEATDEEKLAKLYGYYKECGSLLNGVKYINLRDPQETVPLPVDRY